MRRVVSGLKGIVIHMDDICVIGKSKTEHDTNLIEVFKRLEKEGVTLNPDKCVFGSTQIKYLGHIVSEEGIKPDPKKLEAISKFPVPENVGAVRRFLGMVNYWGKFIPNLSDHTRPLRDLLKIENAFVWGSEQIRSFEKIKIILTSAPLLQIYDPNKNVRISADSSSYGIGAVLEQPDDKGAWKPVAYASKSLSDTEKRLAQIEKEALSLTWACDKFAFYITGKPNITLLTDHRPLIAILEKKHLDELPPRLQRFRMRLMRYSYTVQYIAGKSFHAPDALSRAPLKEEDDYYHKLDLVEFKDGSMKMLPIADRWIQSIYNSQQSDTISQELRRLILTGWPSKINSVMTEVRLYFSYRGHLTLGENIILMNNRIYVPVELRNELLQKIHEGHLGENKCLERARASLWWPGMTKEVKEVVKKCTICLKTRSVPPEPLMPTPLPSLPWEMVGMDIAQKGNKYYLIIIDYYSRWPEVFELSSLSSAITINRCKSAFARHGIPRIVRSDNGPQFSAKEFADFAGKYGFTHQTSSPRYPQSNGLAEAAVKIIKNIFEKNEDPYLGLLAYRNTPISGIGWSPAKLLMGRNLRDNLPSPTNRYIPSAISRRKLNLSHSQSKGKQKRYFDRRRKTKSREPLEPGEEIFSKERQSTGTVKDRSEYPRSYWIDFPDGATLRRNKETLVPWPKKRTPSTSTETSETNNQTRASDQLVKPYTTRSGRVSRPPDRYKAESFLRKGGVIP